MDEQSTAATPTAEVPPTDLAWAAELDEVPADPPITASWRLVAALAASITVAAALLVGVAVLWTHRGGSEVLATLPSPATTPAVTLTPTAPSTTAVPPAAARPTAPSPHHPL